MTETEIDSETVEIHSILTWPVVWGDFAEHMIKLCEDVFYTYCKPVRDTYIDITEKYTLTVWNWASVIRGFHSDVTEDVSNLWCDAVLLSKWVPTFQSIIVPLSLGPHKLRGVLGLTGPEDGGTMILWKVMNCPLNDIVSHPKRLESSPCLSYKFHPTSVCPL